MADPLARRLGSVVRRYLPPEVLRELARALALEVAAARGESSAEARRGLVIAAVEAGASGPVVARALAEGPGSQAAAVDLAATILDGRATASVASRARGGT